MDDSADSVRDKQTIREILYAAFNAGINYFDISDVYNKGQTEIEMGEILREFPRHEIVIASKVFFPMSDDVNDRGLSENTSWSPSIKAETHRRRLPRSLLLSSLRSRNSSRRNGSREDDLVHRGKVLYWGTSEWRGDQLRQVHRSAKNAT
jgi:aryl-alcohol dehydrogenase-like predicted oxidoreductase